MNICEHLTVSAKLFPDKVALVFEEQQFTFAELDGLSTEASQVLVDSGVDRGDRVAIALPNVPAFVVWYYAALRIGAIAVSISTRLTTSEVAFLISDCRAVALISESQTIDQIKKEQPSCLQACIVTSSLGDPYDEEPMGSNRPSTWTETAPHDPALILYTSGTTGFAKGATLSHMNVRSNVHAFNHLCDMKLSDRILLAVPLFHCFGQNALLNSAFNVGATIVLQRSFDLNETKNLIAQEKVTQLYGVPMMFRLFLDSFHPNDLDSVNYCFSAAATLPVQTGRQWQEKFGMPIHEGYGLTETSPFASYNHRLKFVAGSIGMPIDCVEMKIVDIETGADCPPGKLGEIVIRGPNVMLGYWNRPDDTSEAIRDDWFHSGDIGRQDRSGYFYIVDRVKDMITVGGLKVYPAEVERVLLDHPAIAQTAVVGFPDEVSGEQVAAFVVLADHAQESPEQIAEIRQYAKEHLALYKVPRHVKSIMELPRNSSGKILKTELRKLAWPTQSRESNLDVRKLKLPVPSDAKIVDQRSTLPPLRDQLVASHAASRNGLAISYVTNLVQSILGSAKVPDQNMRFLDAGLDSLMIVELSSQIQSEVGEHQEIPPTLVFDHPRISDLGKFLAQTLAPVASTTPPAVGQSPTKSSDFAGVVNEIANLSEEQALEELMKELNA